MVAEAESSEEQKENRSGFNSNHTLPPPPTHTPLQGPVCGAAHVHTRVHAHAHTHTHTLLLSKYLSRQPPASHPGGRSPALPPCRIPGGRLKRRASA